MGRLVSPLRSPLREISRHPFVRAAAGATRAQIFGNLPGVSYRATVADGLIQDRGGLTPVTAASQSIGLLHDWSRASSGWVGASIVVGQPSDFTGVSDGTDITALTGYQSYGAGATTTVQSGRGRIVTTAANTGLRYNSSDAINTAYRVTVDVFTTALNIFVESSAGTSLGTFTLPVGTNQSFIYVRTNGASTRLYFRTNSNNAGGGTSEFDNLRIEPITGNPLIAPTDARRGTWGSFPNSLPGLVCDGNDAYQTAGTVDLTSTDRVCVIAAVQCNTDVDAIIAELSATVATTNDSFGVGRTPTGKYFAGSRGTTTAYGIQTGQSLQPDSAIIVAEMEISPARATVVRNGAQIASNTSSQGTGNYGNHTLNAFCRNAASPSLFFNGIAAELTLIGGAYTTEQRDALIGLAAMGFETSP